MFKYVKIVNITNVVCWDVIIHVIDILFPSKVKTVRLLCEKCARTFGHFFGRFITGNKYGNVANLDFDQEVYFNKIWLRIDKGEKPSLGNCYKEPRRLIKKQISLVWLMIQISLFWLRIRTQIYWDKNDWY